MSPSVRHERIKSVIRMLIEAYVQEKGLPFFPLGSMTCRREDTVLPVRLETRVTEVGTLEVWCVSRDGSQRWKLEFNIREQDEN